MFMSFSKIPPFTLIFKFYDGNAIYYIIYNIFIELNVF